VDSMLSRKVLGIRASIWLVIALLAFHALNNLLIVSRDNTPLMWDGGDYFVKSLKYYDVFAQPGPGFVSRFNAVSPYRPPLFILTPLPLYLFFGRSPDVAVMANLLYLAIMLFSVTASVRGYMASGLVCLLRSFTSTFPIPLRPQPVLLGGFLR